MSFKASPILTGFRHAEEQSEIELRSEVEPSGRLHPDKKTCGNITKPCHSERSEESAVVCFQGDKCRCFAALSMTERFFHTFKPSGRMRHPLVTQGKDPTPFSTNFLNPGPEAGI